MRSEAYRALSAWCGIRHDTREDALTPDYVRRADE